MEYRLQILDVDGAVLDIKAIEASGRRLAINKYLRRFGFIKNLFYIKIKEDSLINVYEVEVILSSGGKIVKIEKMGGKKW